LAYRRNHQRCRQSEIGAGAITVGTAWAHVEAGAHHPSDVLVGVALVRWNIHF